LSMNAVQLFIQRRGCQHRVARDRRMVTKVSMVLHHRCKELVTRAHNLLSRRKVSARQDAMTYLVRVRGLLVDGESLRARSVRSYSHA